MFADPRFPLQPPRSAACHRLSWFRSLKTRSLSGSRDSWISVVMATTTANKFSASTSSLRYRFSLFPGSGWVLLPSWRPSSLQELQCSFNDISREEPHSVLEKLLLSDQPERFRKARAFIRAQGLSADTVAELVSSAVVHAQLASAQDLQPGENLRTETLVSGSVPVSSSWLRIFD